MNLFALGVVKTGLDTADVTAGFTGAAGDVIAMMTGILPIALGIFATVWGIRKVIQFFKSTTA